MDDLIVEGKWQLFEFQNGQSMVSALGNLTPILPELDGYAWNADRLATHGWVSLTQVPEPSAWVMMIFGILGGGGILGMRRFRLCS